MDKVWEWHYVNTEKFKDNFVLTLMDGKSVLSVTSFSIFPEDSPVYRRIKEFAEMEKQDKKDYTHLIKEFFIPE